MHLERGASLLEMMFAIAIVAVAMPFAYRQVSDIGRNMKIMAEARKIISDADPIKNHIRLHDAEFAPDELTLVETDDENKRFYVSKTGGGTTAFLVVKNGWDGLSAHKIARAIGTDAAVSEEDGAAYGVSGEWAISFDGLEPGDIVYRIDAAKSGGDTAKYLHRTILSEGELSTMKRDMSMGNFSIRNAGGIAAKKLNASELNASLVKTPAIAANSLYFSDGLNLNPDKAKFPGVRVNGDAVWFRNLFADDFNSGHGTLTADRASISDKLTVSNKFEVKSSYSRTISGFAGVAAGIARTAFLDADSLTFLPGFGLTVSSELLYSATPPVKLGSWTFPNSSGAGPKFNSLRLRNLGGGEIAPNVSDFSKILKEGWR
ncbi:MAG: hypothetical protein LBT45_00910 [Rickettsiales bacterium]|jgi:hypothetical protein|nr:hypothetical protein [Rickettsiales bacterium]